MTNFTQTYYAYTNDGENPRAWNFKVFFTESNDHCSASCQLMGKLCNYWYVRLNECGHGNFNEEGPGAGYDANVTITIKDSKKCL